MGNLTIDEILRKHFKEPFNSTYEQWKSTPPANYVNDIWRSYARNTKPDKPLNAKLKQASDTLKKFATDFVKQDEYKDLFIVFNQKFG